MTDKEIEIAVQEIAERQANISTYIISLIAERVKK